MTHPPKSRTAQRKFRFLGIALLPLLLSACGHERPTLEDALGTYQFNSRIGPAVLRISLDGNWQYVVKADDGVLTYQGKWTLLQEPAPDPYLRLVLGGFVFGYDIFEGRSPPPVGLKPTNLVLNLEWVYGRTIRSCLLGGHVYCFTKTFDSRPSSLLGK